MTTIAAGMHLAPLRELLGIRGGTDAARWLKALEGLDDTDVRHAAETWPHDRAFKPRDIATIAREAAATRARRDRAIDPPRCRHGRLDTLVDPCQACREQRASIATSAAATIREQLAARRPDQAADA